MDKDSEDFESDYTIPKLSSSGEKPRSSGMFTADREEISEIYSRIDSVIDWIKQFYDRFQYLENELVGIKVGVAKNEVKINDISGDVSSSSSVKFGADLQKLDHGLRALSERVEENRIHANEIERDKKIVGEGVRTNELSTMNRKVNYNLEKSKTILAEVEGVFSKIQKIKNDFQGLASGKDDEDKVTKSRDVLEAWNKVPGLGESMPRKIEPPPAKKEYKRLVDEDDNSKDSYPVGSKEWLREVKRISKQ